MSEAPIKKPNYKGEIIVVVGYLLFFCLVGGAGIFFYPILRESQAQARINPITTSLPALTPNPHVPSGMPPDAPVILSDDFSTDQNSWRDIPSDAPASVEDGHLSLFPPSDYILPYRGYAMATCYQLCTLDEPYFLQVDLSTNNATQSNFGVAFAQVPNFNADFHLFAINPESGSYSLYYHYLTGWYLRTSGKNGMIHPYPATNRLGLYVNQDLVELYINGVFLDSYHEAGFSLQDGNIAFFVGDGGFTLTIHHLIIYKE